MSWFEEWFNSPYYHILYSHRNEEEAQYFIDNLLAFLKPVNTAKFLDLACGKGRHSKYISSKGYETVGIDIAADSIQDAKKFENSKLRFYVHDMRLPFPESGFDYILNLFTSFGYFNEPSDNLKVLQNVVNALNPSGVFVLDFLHLHYVEKHLIPKETIQRKGIIFHITRKIDGGFIYKNIEVVDDKKYYTYHEKVQALQLDDFNKMFLQVGLKIFQQFGDYNLTDFDKDSSPRLILLAQKEA